MSNRSPLHFAVRFAACSAALVFARQLTAQEPRAVVIGGHGVATTIAGTLPISDNAVRTLIDTHFPEALRSEDGVQHVTIVIDAYDQYVTGKVAKATLITASSDDNGVHAFVVGDTTIAGSGGRIMVRRVEPGAGPLVVLDSTMSGVSGRVVVRRIGDGDGAVVVGPAAAGVLRERLEDGANLGGVFGSGYGVAEIASIGLKRFSAGQLGAGQLMVSVIRLK
jgi:hypothetical protein